MTRTLLILWALAATAASISAQPLTNAKHSDTIDRFYQIDSWLPTPNMYRTASGAPGPKYWQQRADYEIDVTLDDENQRIEGRERIKYHNRSPHTLNYVWVQLDQNIFEPDSDSNMTSRAPGLSPRISFRSMNTIMARMTFDGGYKIESVTDGKDKPIRHHIVKTMMRLDLDEPLQPGKSTDIKIRYSFNINNSKVISARCGYEHFEADDNNIYEMAQWFPRVVSYTDYTGWQHKQFLGRGEFTLELGDYKVRITVPEDMIVGSTGELQNVKEVLKPEWAKRLQEAKASKKPVYIITPEEAKKNESNRGKKTKTWVFHAKNVRDFAFAASRKFIWDAMGVDVAGRKVLAMSYWPGEAEPLWSQYSTEAIAHTLEVYGRYSFEYPYPVAISVNGPVYGMEYPMICFNGPRPEKDGTYSKATKYGLISVIIHEVGHNFFPMIVNSDERQWTWMDEGLNTFLQYLTEQEWEEDYPSRRGDPEKIVPYMRSGNQRPIMTGSEEILQFGPNAYSKPATALNILRETILGRELFDFAFREYAQRWKFKRPTPSDFFRTMEDASGVDLDWFWRGWFYSTEHVDIAIEDVKLYQIDNSDPDAAAERKRIARDQREPTLSKERNEPLPKRIEWQAGLKDYYNSPEHNEIKVEDSARKAYQRYLDSLSDEQRKMLARKTNFYVVRFRNVGGLVMPIIVRLHYADDTSEMFTLPAQIWRSDSQQVDRLFVTDKEVTRFHLDPRRETADTEESNNHYPPRLVPSRFKLYKSSRGGGNEMRTARDAAKKKAAEAKKQADLEAKKKTDEAKKKADEAKKEADAKKKKSDAEADKKSDAEATKKAEAEASKKPDADVKKKPDEKKADEKKADASKKEKSDASQKKADDQAKFGADEKDASESQSDKTSS